MNFKLKLLSLQHIDHYIIHTLSCYMQGQVYVNGQGDSGQLGLGNRQGIAADPTLVPFPYDEYNVVFITAGIAHNSK